MNSQENASNLVLPQLETHPLWKETLQVLGRLRDGGFEAFLVGGCVRDALLGVSPKDFDVATNARPDQVEALFPEAIPIGKQFGIMMVPVKLPRARAIEIATFRKDGKYEDGRRPQDVEFSEINEDAARRDFTINALFCDPLKGEVLDFFEGKKDLVGKTLRAVGEPTRRFEEDHLRPLRALRFAAQLGFTVEPKTMDAVKKGAQRLRAGGAVSRERVHDEIWKLMDSTYLAQGFRLLIETGVGAAIFPKFMILSKAYLTYGKHFAIELENLVFQKQPKLVLAFFVLFELSVRSRFALNFKWDPSLNDIIADLKELHFSNEQVGILTSCLRNEKNFTDITSLKPAKVLKILDSEVGTLYFDLLQLTWAEDSSAQIHLESIRLKFLELAQETGHLPKSWVSGELLKQTGLAPGPQWRDLLETAYEMQLEGKLEGPKAAEKWLLSQAALLCR